MPIVAQGGTVTLNARVGHANGNPADDAALTLTILDTPGDPVAGFPVAIPPIVRDDLGAYHYVWAVPALLAIGDYTAHWDATVDGADAGGDEQIEVVDPGSVVTDVYLCDLVDVKQRLGIVDTTDDAWLLGAIIAITDEITSITGRSFAPDPASGTKTVYLDSNWGSSIRLPRGVRSVTYLGVAGTDQPETGGTYTEITSAYYYIDPPAHERSNGWPGTRITLGTNASPPFRDARRGVKVTGTFGFAAVPAAIRAIAEMLVVSAFRARGSGGANTFTIGIEGERTYQRLLTTKDLVTLRWYADIPV